MGCELMKLWGIELKKKKNGATLLEVIIALAIISIMMVPIMNSVLQSVTFNKKSEDLKEAKLIGQQVVENLRNQDVIESGQILRLNNNELRISSRGVKNRFDVESLSEINGFTVDGEIIKESEILSNEYYNMEVGGFIVVNKNEMYYKEATPGYRTFAQFYKEEKEWNHKIADITSEIELELNNGKLSLKSKGNVIWNGKLVGTGKEIAFIIHDKSDHKILLNNTGQDMEVYGFRSNKITAEEGFVKERIDFIGNKIKQVVNVLYDYKYRTKGLYSIDLTVSKDTKVIERLEYQFNVGGGN